MCIIPSYNVARFDFDFVTRLIIVPGSDRNDTYREGVICHKGPIPAPFKCQTVVITSLIQPLCHCNTCLGVIHFSCQHHTVI